MANPLYTLATTNLSQIGPGRQQSINGVGARNGQQPQYALLDPNNDPNSAAMNPLYQNANRMGLPVNSAQLNTWSADNAKKQLMKLGYGIQSASDPVRFMQGTYALLAGITESTAQRYDNLMSEFVNQGMSGSEAHTVAKDICDREYSSRSEALLTLRGVDTGDLTRGAYLATNKNNTAAMNQYFSR